MKTTQLIGKAKVNRAVKITHKASGNSNTYRFSDVFELAQFYAKKKLELYPFDIWTVEYVND